MSSTRGRIGAAAPMLSRAGRSLSGSGHRRQCILSRIVPLSTTGPTRRGTPEKQKINSGKQVQEKYVRMFQKVRNKVQEKRSWQEGRNSI